MLIYRIVLGGGKTDGIRANPCSSVISSTTNLIFNRRFHSDRYQPVWVTHRINIPGSFYFLFIQACTGRVLQEPGVRGWHPLTAASNNKYEGWNFNFGNAAVTFDTTHLHSSYFHRPSMYSPKLCRTRSQWWGSRMMLWQPLFCWWSGRSGLERKAWTHLATVLYGNAAVPQASSSPR